MRIARAIQIAVIAGGIVAAQTASAQAATPCGRAGSDTVLQTGTSRLYEREFPGGDEPSGTSLWGCTRNRTPVRMGREWDNLPYGFSAYGHASLRGRFAAVMTHTFHDPCRAACPEGYDHEHMYVEVFNLWRGTRARRIEVPALGGTPVLSIAGGVAWTEPVSGGYIVRVAAGGGPRVLDPGPAVDVKSLRLRHGVLHWTVGGEPRSVAMPR